MRTPLRSALAAAGVVTLLATGSVAAAEYHVAVGAPTAADGNPGTADKPWRTLAKAAQTAQPGDTVLVHAGTYPESVTLQNAGTPDKPITFRAFADDDVVLEGADGFAADRWSLVPGSKRVYATILERDPGLVLVDGKPVYVKVDRVKADYPRQYKPGVLTDADAGFYQYDDKAKRLLLNVGDEPGKHAIEVPVRTTAVVLRAYSRLSGVQARHYVHTAIRADGDDAVVEDCVVRDSGGGIVTSGWDRRGVVIRRNTVVGALGNGILLQDRPTHCLVEDNLAVRCTLNPLHADDWLGSIKMNSASDTVFAHNVVLEAGNPNTDCGHDGWSLWGDINIVRIVYLGNTCANSKEAGLYVEYAMGDTRAYFNTSYRNGHGITCRQSQRGVFMRNLVLESRGSGLAVWGGDAPYSTTDNVFAHNLVRDCNPAIALQIEHPNFSNYNTYWPGTGNALATGQAPAGGKTPSYKGLAEWSAATGHDLKSEVRDAQPEDVGLGTVTFRVAEAKDPAQVLMMVGNGGCEWENPAGVNTLPYFWRPGTGDGQAHVFPYAAYCGLPGGCDAFAFGGAGGTVGLVLDPTDPKQPKSARSGLRCLRIDGLKPEQMCRDGLGYWSPSLPARAGDTVAVGLSLRGQALAPATGEAAVTVFAEFATATGQHRQRVDLAPGQPLAGTFDWTAVSATAKVPAGASRIRLFLGLRPATGTLFVDDITLKVR